jgi:hypothetical protein
MVTVQNTGSSVERYRLDVSGIPAGCYDLDQPRVTLPASASAHVPLAVYLPAGAISAASRYPVTVQVTSEDDPTHRASAGFVLIVESGSGLDMDVRPAEATGRDATFHIAFLNQAPAPAVVALTVCDREDALCVHIEPPDPVVVPPGVTAALATVHVRPKRRRTGDRPQRYAIEFRGRRVGPGPLSTPALVAHARFTYVLRPALLRPGLLPRPVWLRRLPVSTLALMLTLLLVLLLQAYLATQPTAAPPAAPTPVLPTVAPRPSAAPVTDVPVPTAAASPPALVLMPDTLSFGTQDVHTTSAARVIHLVNLGPTALTIASVSITGTNPREFSAADACAGTTTGTTMSAYNGCTIRIRFTPGRSGARRASLVIADNAADTPQIVPLNGNGRRPRR